MTLSTDTMLPSDDLPVVIELAGVPDRADAPVSEITERFLKTVLAHVPLDRIEELHLFSPLRQGGVETGIAVIAARVLAVASMEPELPFDDVVSDVALEEAPIEAPPIEAPEIEVVEAPAPRVRHTVLTARYRLVQKGPDRGKWEADVVAEADAPLVTVDLVVRGVQRRAGEESEIVRYSSAQLARALRMPFPPV